MQISVDMWKSTTTILGGTVCDIGWDDADAHVACRQSGYSVTGATIVNRSDTPEGSGQI